MLHDLELQADYRSGRDALLNDFYIPCLQEATLYDRAVGYFSSALLHATALAYSDFVRRGGRMRLVCSPRLAEADFAAMKAGEAARERAYRSIEVELALLLDNPLTLPATTLLSTLIAAEVLEVRIAFPSDERGIFHEKLGIFEDQSGRRVTFVGSANETYAAWGLNSEAFEVFGSWWGESELLRTRNHASNFTRLWENRAPGIESCGLSEVARTRLRAIEADDVESAIAHLRVAHQPFRKRRKLLDHQIRVLESWEAGGRRGIVNFATGAGKTLTALKAIATWSRPGWPTIVLVPGRELHRQWLGEILAEMPEAHVLPAGAGHPKAEWEALLPTFTRNSPPGSPPHIVLATNATFASPEFQDRVSRHGKILLVADELHRTGSPVVRRALEAFHAAGTLGLSATYERKYDSAGTAALVEFYGPVLEPVIGIAEALAAGLLVPYDYYLHPLTLGEDEWDRYEALSLRIRKAVGGSPSDGDLPDYVKMLLIRRARILKSARGKAPMAAEILSAEYRPGDRWLVYCDDTSQLTEVTRLGLARGLPMIEYYSQMRGDRESALTSLREHGGIVVAIRCLDEGVDIPVAEKALILASSTVEREYIQRRGRVLRWAPEKHSAEIHDLLLTDPEGGALTAGEARRALEFATLSRNAAARAQLRVMVAMSRDVLAGVGPAHLDLFGSEDDDD